ncbi:MAG TPA: hypothetical protein VHH34_17585 [Pseudonocardiaceae bacterium]|nr:hypothetical protein [Pseudonocardiaceae bacterium]
MGAQQTEHAVVGVTGGGMDSHRRGELRARVQAPTAGGVRYLLVDLSAIHRAIGPWETQ